MDEGVVEVWDVFVEDAVFFLFVFRVGFKVWAPSPECWDEC